MAFTVLERLPCVRRALPAAGLMAALGGALVSAQQAPTFQARVDVIPVDVGVIDGRGQPVPDLTAADFTVRIDGQPRRIVSAEWISLTANRAEAPSIRVPAGYASNEQAAGSGRLIVLAIDQPSIPFTAVRPLQDTVNRFIDRLPPTDRIAAVGFGQGAPSVSFTPDRERVKQAIARMPGQQPTSDLRHQVGISTALAIDRDGNPSDACEPRCSSPLLNAIVSRDCPPPSPPPPPPGAPGRIPTKLGIVERAACVAEVVSEATDVARAVRQESDNTLRSLRALLTGLKGIDAPKTLLLISQRFFVDTERDGVEAVNELGALASSARTSIYAVRLQEDAVDISRSMQSVSPVEDRRLEQQGLEALVGAARGALFNVAGTGAGVFDRLGAELSGYYLLGVEPVDRDRDGKAHPIAVDVARRGITVRTRRSVLAGAAETPAPLARDTVIAALSSPLPFSSLPMRGIAFALGGPDPSKLQLLIHTDIGEGYTAPTRLAVGYVILDRDGHQVDGQVTEARFPPAANGVPTPIPFAAGGSVAPGDYTVKLVAADGDHVGSLEIPLHARLVDAGAFRYTDLMAGGPVPPGDRLRPTIGSRVGFGTVHGYFEAYGPAADALAVTFEIAANDSDPALLTVDVPAQKAGADRVLYSQMVVVQSLPPGAYRLRARIVHAGVPLTTLVRAFELTSNALPPATTAVVSSVSRDLAIAVEAKDLTPAFRRDDVLKPETVAPFRDRVAAAARPAFEQGIAHMRTGAYADAETSFRLAMRQDRESDAPLVYLAACLGAAGYNTEAASALQTAIARGSDAPQIYEWLGEALMRAQSFAEARTVLEEAEERFPASSRFARPLALLYATSGKGRDAVKTLDRYLADRPGDTRAEFLIVQWIYNLHRGGAVVRDRAADVQLARTYAERYVKTNPPDQALVRQWLQDLEREK